MAIKPEECGPLSELDKKQIQECEDMIDKFLKEHYNLGKGEITVLHAICINRLSSKARKEIIKRYEDAGWRLRNVGGPGIGESTWYFSVETLAKS
jgi:hypothetical protein